MKDYVVTIAEMVIYEVPVSAADADTARDEAYDLLVDSADRDKWCTEVSEREVEGVSEA